MGVETPHTPNYDEFAAPEGVPSRRINAGKLNEAMLIAPPCLGGALRRETIITPDHRTDFHAYGAKPIDSCRFL